MTTQTLPKYASVSALIQARVATAAVRQAQNRLAEIVADLPASLYLAADGEVYRRRPPAVGLRPAGQAGERVMNGRAVAEEYEYQRQPQNHARRSRY